VTASADDYPYRPNEPWRNVHQVYGLEKLCYIRDRELAKELFNMYQALAERDKLMDIAKRAHTGMMGQEPERLAQQYFGKVLGHPSMNALKDFVPKVRQVTQSRAGRSGEI